MSRFTLWSIILLASAMLGPTVLAQPEDAPVNLRCEYLANPLGIDVLRPRLSWEMSAATSSVRGRGQSAWQVLVASSPEALGRDEGDLWDSGRVASDQSTQIEYAGKGLKSRMRCWWKVRVWDKQGQRTDWSEPALWSMGLFAPGDWQAQWIGYAAEAKPQPDYYTGDPVPPSPMLRKAFKLDRPVQSALLYICGLGFYDLHLNGQRVGDHRLDPLFTRYDRRCLYVTHDVTRQLRAGDNVVAVQLGNGWYNEHARSAWDFDKAPWRDLPKLLLQLEVEYEDGTRAVVASDERWKAATGPVVFDGIRRGEVYDARREEPGWNDATGGEERWAAAKVVAAPKGILTAQQFPPIRATRTIPPVKITQPKPGVYLCDLGQNIAGWARLSVTGPAGTQVVLKYGERLNADGTVDQAGIHQHVKVEPFQTDRYILKGGGVETWEPRFVYHGFRWIEVHGFPGELKPENLIGIVAHSAFEAAGSFECSNDLLNRIERCAQWAYLGNFVGMPTDCPHREKNGWTGDAHLAAEMGLLHFQGESAYTKWMQDFLDEQKDDGSLPGIVPTGGWGYAWGNGPAWDSAYILIPWYLYEYRGDKRILAVHYDRMKRYVDYLGTKAKAHIVSIGLGDWVPAKTQTPAEVTSTAYWAVDARIVSQAAQILGNADDAKKYAQLAEDIRRAFNARFYDRGTGLYAGGTQTAMSCALYQGLVDPAERQRVVDGLVRNVEQHDNHLDTGILGAKYLLHALSDNGRTDVAYRIASQKSFPSWGLWVEQGATTLWENWNGADSQNHIMFGDISAWFIRDLAGINPDPQAPGFKRVIIRPRLVDDLQWARAEHRGPYGWIRCGWKRENGAFTLDVTIPPNSNGTVFIPVSSGDAVREGDRPAAGAPGVKLLRMEGGCAVFEVVSGTYRFTAPATTK